jgi:hypothetical protein
MSSRIFLWTSALLSLLSAEAFINIGPTRNLPKQKQQICSSVGVRRTHFPHRFGSLSLRAQEQGQEPGDKKSVVDKIASKGIWQFDMNKETEDALAAVGWIEGNEVDEREKIPVSQIRREDIDALVQKAVNAEIFADERSKQVCHSCFQAVDLLPNEPHHIYDGRPCASRCSLQIQENSC